MKTFALTISIAVQLACATSSFAATFRAGFASADITPPVDWRRAGNYTELISTGVNDPLMTKAMVVQDGATTFAFVGNDLCSVPRDLTDLARLRASQPAGIPVANIVTPPIVRFKPLAMVPLARRHRDSGHSSFARRLRKRTVLPSS